ncbi:DNA alkylation repair protein [Candidatus Woesebacteria bacterium RIFCSPHIGHO2_02_FULL_38_9]|uniref:DNA alkylation repair protein n=1 Tax=Candidatus Woesebacteria bacterium RIFCSPHIGHO2_01_FULL_39_28 TaxID=1802496 RepID=A0A1F7YM71_9BACT|nr:MAG: DNA alkylation repair protein [Candidatus Woesebacteria bacterium RIFCSPHIGHO2_01_FULL_39_28]OGM33198.1 MAG: DNA alkylation repair protein [Candidatus Woesebacteria bacterium RIFCSPHIGHO2_02_FULL_38_9]OGM57087.1 MAG: DNA alkylation repair protein [Candidatus Woesebacteria bacterium RIFCSPLOWO2_01_FULL_38_20]
MKEVLKELNLLRNPPKAKILQGFFKTGKGEYGEGDLFLGISVPQSRKIAIKYKNLPFSEIQKLLKLRIHEARLIALLILVENFKKADEKTRKVIYEFYLLSTEYINNWDLVDLSAGNIVGNYLEEKDTSILVKLAKSESLWERRIAVISTFDFIMHKNAKETLKIAEILINDKEDLIQKAVGWMLREVGKRVSQEVEEEFLNKYYRTMPRTTLRYAIERFDPKLREKYLKGFI